MPHARMPTPGAIALAIAMMLSTACAGPQTTGVATTPEPPEYDADTLDCVADAIEAEEWRGCLEGVVVDWMVWVGV